MPREVRQKEAVFFAPYPSKQLLKIVRFFCCYDDEAGDGITVEAVPRGRWDAVLRRDHAGGAALSVGIGEWYITVREDGARTTRKVQDGPTAVASSRASHARKRAQAEEREARFEREQRASAEHQATGAQCGIVDEDFIGGVERAVLAGEFVEIETKEVRAQRLAGLAEGIREFHELAGQRDLGGRLGRSRGGVEGEIGG